MVAQYTNFGITLNDDEVRGATGIDFNSELVGDVEGKVERTLAFYVDNMGQFILSFYFSRQRALRIISENQQIVKQAICSQIVYAKNSGDLISFAGVNLADGSTMDLASVKPWFICDQAKRLLVTFGVLRGR